MGTVKQNSRAASKPKLDATLDPKHLRGKLEELTNLYDLAALVADPEDEGAVIATAAVIRSLLTILGEHPKSAADVLSRVGQLLFIGFQHELAGGRHDLASAVRGGRNRLRRLAAREGLVQS